MTADQKKANRRMALLLACVAATFFVGFMARIILLNH